MQENNNLPLHARTHWRRVKETTVAIANYEQINLNSYNLNTITCYSTYGESFIGSNVTYVNNTGESPWVSNNQYDVYEIPSRTNSAKYSFCGDYLFLAHNISFDYWLFGTLTDKLDYVKTKETNSLVESAKYCVYGEYTITIGTNPTDINVKKVTQGKNVTYGGNVKNAHNEIFDSFSERKKAFCKKTNSQIASEILGNKNSSSAIADKNAVKKYNKNQKKRK